MHLPPAELAHTTCASKPKQALLPAIVSLLVTCERGGVGYLQQCTADFAGAIGDKDAQIQAADT